MKNFFGRILLVLAITGALLSGSLAQAADEIKIGIVDTYSGPASTYCNDILDGFKLAVDKINAKGGVAGKKITFVTRDDKFKVDLGLSAAKELIMREKVNLLMGTINSAVALAVSDLARRRRSRFLSPIPRATRLQAPKAIVMSFP